MNYEELQRWANKLDLQQVFDISTSNNVSGTDKNISYSVARLLKSGRSPSFKQLNQLKRIYDNFYNKDPNKATLHEIRFSNLDPLESDIKNLCLRTAWHDNRWNGNICLAPESNEYCIGEYSLLSERVRRRRRLEIEDKPECRGCKADSAFLNEYQPPCFWSVNTFGPNELTFKHDNPIAPEFPHITEILPPYSLISWPFKLSFVRNQEEKEQYKGNYYPKEIFERRIKHFQRLVAPSQSIVFTYCNFSNPVSGEDMKYLVTGCALLAEQGEPQYFDVSDEQLAKRAEALKQPNFPSMNWALRYTLDFENTGLRIPYHEYLDFINQGKISENLLDEIAVSINEPELREGFSYVARHIDDDQAIYLLLKIRQSFIKIKSHGLLNEDHVSEQLQRIDELVGVMWNKRGYLPGLKSLLLSISIIRDHYQDSVYSLIKSIDLSNKDTIINLLAAFNRDKNDLREKYPDIFHEVGCFMEELSIDGTELLRLASLNITCNQFSRIINKLGIRHNLAKTCKNPYLLYEEYEPGEITEDSHTGETIDGPIDLYKIDLALIPLAKYQQRIEGFHIFTESDCKRLRAVIVDILRSRESEGDCFLDVGQISKIAEGYPLFFKGSTPYMIEDFIKNPKDFVDAFFQEKLVKQVFANETRYYLKDLYDDELYIAEIIKQLMARHDHSLTADSLRDTLDYSIHLLRNKIGERFDEDAFRAEREDFYNKIAGKSFFVITGLPGAGKSYELLKFVEFLNKNSENHIVLSLTGKAVLRLKNNDEGIKSINAKTIDKFLTEQDSAKSQAATCIYNNLIIDETSMVDLCKLAQVLRSIDLKSLKRLILVGDQNQLPPIGFGKPFSDIINMMDESREISKGFKSHLEVNCRAEMSEKFISFTRIFSNECNFSEGYLSSIDDCKPICDNAIEFVYWSSRDELHQKVKLRVSSLLKSEGLREYQLPEFLGINASEEKPSGLERFQTITPYKSGYFGASGLNIFFQDHLRKNVNFERKSGDIVFKLHDKVMHTKNEYSKNQLLVSNGSLGAILSRGRVFFTDNDNPLRIDDLKTKNMLELAYAITVHKSQGSGFNHVYIVLPEKAVYTSRELVYTALTRARKKVTIFIQQGKEIPCVPEFLNKIILRSGINGRRTTLFNDGTQSYEYSPEAGVIVKSRVEYIIYRKLLDAKAKHGNFTFAYEDDYSVLNHNFVLHPDFTLRFADGRVVYWEHLGKVTSKSYVNDWDKRREIYQLQNDYSNVLTTDELHGINNSKIDTIIELLIKNNLTSEDTSNRFSKYHFSLN
jgi:exodeoxyribonuclease V alpha subunit